MSPATKAHLANLRTAVLQSSQDLVHREYGPDFLFLPRQRESQYRIGFALSERCIERAQRLRYEVFNMELQEGLDSSHVTGLDADEFDAQMSHLLVIDMLSSAIVGVYRLQTATNACARRGLYSAQEFDLTDLAPYLPASVELGRACIAKDHRNGAVLMQLWCGIVGYAAMNRQRWLFGCCSLTTQDPADGWRAMRTIMDMGQMHETLYLPARPEHLCRGRDEAFDETSAPYVLPKLFRTYLRLGAKVASEPVLDKEFGTVDFLVIADLEEAKLNGLRKVGQALADSL